VSLDSDTPGQDDAPAAWAIDPPATEPVLADSDAETPAGPNFEPAETAASEDAEVPADAVAHAIEDLARQVERLNDRAANREAVIDALHTEVEALRRGERKALLRPILTAGSRLRDGLLTQSESLPADIDAARTAQLLASFADEVEMLLSDNGVAVETPVVGAAFDPRRQRVMETIPTSDESAHGTIAHVGRSGYVELESDTLFARAGVSVYGFVPAAQSAESHESPEIADGLPETPTCDMTGEQ
jgi:molecular chaperone GrpE